MNGRSLGSRQEAGERHELVSAPLVAQLRGSSLVESRGIKPHADRTRPPGYGQQPLLCLSGRPQYGYHLVDLGPHPNPGKAVAGQRLHRLEPDPVAAPVVERIFREYVAGKGLYRIAEALTRDGILCRPRTTEHETATATASRGRSRLSGRSCATRATPAGGCGIAGAARKC